MGVVTKSRPIDPFLDVIYLFLNVRFGQKMFKLAHFWMPSSTFWMCNLPLFCRQLSVFYSFLPKFFWRPFFLAHTPIFSHSKNLYTLPKNFHPILLPPLSNFHFLKVSKKVGCVNPRLRHLCVAALTKMATHHAVYDVLSSRVAFWDTFTSCLTWEIARSICKNKHAQKYGDANIIEK